MTFGVDGVRGVSFLFKGRCYPHEVVVLLSFFEGRGFTINRRRLVGGYPLSVVGVRLPAPKSLHQTGTG